MVSTIAHVFLYFLLTNLNSLLHFDTSLQLVKEVIPIRIIVRPTIAPAKSLQNRDQKGPTSGDAEAASVLISNASLSGNLDKQGIESSAEHSTQDGANSAVQTIIIKYPQLSRLNHEEGITYVVLQENNAVMVRSSGYSRLDAEAMSAVQQLLLKQNVREGQKYKVEFKLD